MVNSLSTTNHALPMQAKSAGAEEYTNCISAEG